MKVTIIAFGQLKEIIPESIELNATTTDELQSILSNKFPELSNKKYALAINKKKITGSTSLNNNDTIALLPPFSGG